MKKKTTEQKDRGTGKSRAQWIKENEFVLCGWNACMRAFENRPEEIRRAFFSEGRSGQVDAVKRWCRERKLPYRELDAESLNKAADSVHHEGIVMVVRPPRLESIHSLALRGLAPDAVLVALDRVGNAHNVGAILRSCAYFGAAGLLVGMEKGQALVTPSAARMAEGALETVPLYESSDLPSALRDLRARNAFVLGADLAAGRSLYEIEIPFPCVAVLGNERDGLSDRVKKRCDALVRVPGNGVMQSLNVSVAAGVILAEISRRKTVKTRHAK